MLSSYEKVVLYQLLQFSEDNDNTHGEQIKSYNERGWLHNYYRFIFLGKSLDESVGETETSDVNTDSTKDLIMKPESAIWLVRRAEQLYDQLHTEDAYRLARQAYTMDPFDWRGLLVYIASMVSLSLKTELFYLGHELAHTHPKVAITWYAVGCYYWSCRKLELAQRYLMKATKIDKRFAKAWVLLGHTLAAQEESEHAISAFRTASRLLPGDHRPLVFMAKELVRTNSLSLSLHLLQSAIAISPNCILTLNEMGVVLLRLGRGAEALEHLESAVILLRGGTGGQGGGGKVSLRKGHGEEVLNNYATSLRKSGRIDESLHWYTLCLSINPNDSGTHANMAFSLHLMKRFDEAITHYHKALALQPTYTFCSEMLSRAIQDSLTYSTSASTKL